VRQVHKTTDKLRILQAVKDLLMVYLDLEQADIENQPEKFSLEMNIRYDMKDFYFQLKEN
jgi:hypothetical protein